MLGFRLVINISLSTSYYGIDPNSCSRIWCCLQMVAAPFCFHNECAMRSTTLRCIQMVQVYLIDGLPETKKKQIGIKTTMQWEFEFFETNKNSAKETYREVGTTSGFSFGFVRIIDERSLLSIQYKPALWPRVECGTQFMKISVCFELKVVEKFH